MELRDGKLNYSFICTRSSATGRCRRHEEFRYEHGQNQGKHSQMGIDSTCECRRLSSLTKHFQQCEFTLQMQSLYTFETMTESSVSATQRAVSSRRDCIAQQQERTRRHGNPCFDKERQEPQGSLARAFCSIIARGPFHGRCSEGREFSVMRPSQGL